MATITEVAGRFGGVIARADYAGAHALLTKQARQLHSPAEFKDEFEQMTAYQPGPIREVKVMSDFILEDWPDKQEGDVAMVYVALGGDGFCEAVTLTLTREGGDIRIRDLEWGRP